MLFFCDHGAKLRHKIGWCKSFSLFLFFVRIFSFFAQNDWCLSQALGLLRGSDHRFYEGVATAFTKVSP